MVRVSTFAVPRLDMKPRAAAHAEAAALGLLQQHGADQRRNDHQVDHDNDSLHLVTFRRKPKAPAGAAASWSAGFEVARCYTIGRAHCHPRPDRRMPFS